MYHPLRLLHIYFNLWSSSAHVKFTTLFAIYIFIYVTILVYLSQYLSELTEDNNSRVALWAFDPIVVDLSHTTHYIIMYHMSNALLVSLVATSNVKIYLKNTIIRLEMVMLFSITTDSQT